MIQTIWCGEKIRFLFLKEKTDSLFSSIHMNIVNPRWIDKTVLSIYLSTSTIGIWKLSMRFALMIGGGLNRANNDEP